MFWLLVWYGRCWLLIIIALLIYLYLTLSDQSKQTSGSYSMSKKVSRAGRLAVGLADEIMNLLILPHLYLR